MTGPRWPPRHPSKYLTGREIEVCTSKLELGLLQRRTKVKDSLRARNPSYCSMPLSGLCEVPFPVDRKLGTLLLAYLAQDAALSPPIATLLPTSLPNCFHPGFQSFLALNASALPRTVPSTRRQAGLSQHLVTPCSALGLCSCQQALP